MPSPPLDTVPADRFSSMDLPRIRHDGSQAKSPETAACLRTFSVLATIPHRPTPERRVRRFSLSDRQAATGAGARVLLLTLQRRTRPLPGAESPYARTPCRPESQYQHTLSGHAVDSSNNPSAGFPPAGGNPCGSGAGRYGAVPHLVAERHDRDPA